MDILAALKQEESKWKKQVSEARQQLETVRAAMKLFGGKTTGKRTGGKKRVMSAAARAKISRAQRKRWAKVKAKSD